MGGLNLEVFKVGWAAASPPSYCKIDELTAVRVGGGWSSLACMSCSRLASCTTLAPISTTDSPFPTFGRERRSATRSRGTGRRRWPSTSASSRGSDESGRKRARTRSEGMMRRERFHLSRPLRPRTRARSCSSGRPAETRSAGILNRGGFGVKRTARCLPLGDWARNYNLMTVGMNWALLGGKGRGCHPFTSASSSPPARPCMRRCRHDEPALLVFGDFSPDAGHHYHQHEVRWLGCGHEAGQPDRPPNLLA